MIRFILATGAVILTVFAVTFSEQPQNWTESAQRDFLKKHWQVPVPPQGRPPAKFSALEASLEPSSCGTCHSAQFEEWKTTIHSRSIGPGLLGQMPTLLRTEPETAVMCYNCHSPLTEQHEIIQTPMGFKKNPSFDSALQSHGVTCASCHVRGNQRFGPPQRNGSLEGSTPSDQAPHGGAIRTPAFEQAEFCKGCHQFEEGDKALNGKLLENTYNEWKGSPYSKQGIVCQQCHMQDRRHLWRGIHDPDMVKRGVGFELTTNQAHYAAGDELEAILTLTNRAVGHYFPTYITPKVILKMEFLDAHGHPISGSQQQEAINREVTIDISEEIYDSRIPPKGKHTFRYARSIDREGLSLHAVVTVYPDEFYQRFYEAKLTGRLLPNERKRLTEALEHSRRSEYKLFEKEIRF